jgi:hypothetical protein
MKRAASRAYISTLMMEVICFSEWYVDFQRITWRYITEDVILQDILVLEQ